VIGVTMQACLQNTTDAGCIFDTADAIKVADTLGIPCHTINLSDTFTQEVIADFCEEYKNGRTPNPCVRCNEHIKFGVLWDKAAEMGAEFMATGHYARIKKDEAPGRYLLKKGADSRKDQSYMLYRLSQEQLSRTILPLGNHTKEQVRELAKEFGLPAADKPESQDICFIPDDDHIKFLSDKIPEAAIPGPIIDAEGNILGKHRGYMFYTVGQRRGLNIAFSEPLYVVKIDPQNNAVIVGTREQVRSSKLIASTMNWIAVDSLPETMRVKARIRYHHKEADASVTPVEGDSVCVEFSEPQMAITPGQSVVFYNGDIVLGGGIIKKI